MNCLSRFTRRQSITEEQKRKIRDMRIGGHSYAEIADVLGLPRDTIKKHCQRHPVASTTFHCLYCNMAIPTVHGRKQRNSALQDVARLGGKSILKLGIEKLTIPLPAPDAVGNFNPMATSGENTARTTAISAAVLKAVLRMNSRKEISSMAKHRQTTTNPINHQLAEQVCNPTPDYSPD